VRQGSDGWVAPALADARVCREVWWLILLMLVFAVAGFGLWCVMTRQDAERERRHRAQRALAARADQQHAWVLDGDDRGLYGRYPPAAT
jgi:hypothetical protein